MEYDLTQDREECSCCGQMRYCIAEYTVMGTRVNLCVDCFEPVFEIEEENYEQKTRAC